MDFTCMVVGIVFIIFGFLLAIGKLHKHLKAWKNTPKELQEKINIKGLCLNIGEVIMLSGLIFLLRGIFPEFNGYYFVIAIVAWIIIAVFDLVYIYKSKHYEKK